MTPQQIEDLPVNGREYLDLLQLVPGVAINRQSSGNVDEANPVLGERGGNNNFFIDGQPNKDTVNGGPAAQFNQETIAEFQVLTTGFKAEFGQASGAIINVITKSGGNGFHGVGSLFHRNEAFDSSNSLDAATADAPIFDDLTTASRAAGRLSKIDSSFSVQRNALQKTAESILNIRISAHRPVRQLFWVYCAIRKDRMTFRRKRVQHETSSN